MPLKIIAFLSCKPGCEAALEAAAALVVAGSRAEPGCLRYDLWRESAGARRYVIDELFVDEAAIQAHRLTGHYIAFRATFAELLDVPPATAHAETRDVAA